MSVHEATDVSPTSPDDLRFVQDLPHLPVLRRIRISERMRKALNKAANETDVIHNHGLWLAPNLYAGWSARHADKPLVVSPRGMLSEEALKYSPAKKRLFWLLLQEPAFSQTACYHATSIAEYASIRSFGIEAPIAIIPNGIDLPPLPPRNVQENRTALFIGRLHPIKGLDVLIRAWSLVRQPGWRLSILGGDEQGYERTLQDLIASMGLADVVIKGPIAGHEKLQAFRDADLFVLPSLSENFAITVAEALSAETPVISTKGAPWQGVEANRCGWWIDQGVPPLAEALSRAMALPQTALRDMGANGRAWMERDYSWDRVGTNMIEVYRWLEGSCAPPATVRMN